MVSFPASACLVWYRSSEALESIAATPDLRQPLLDDELSTFSTYIRDTAILTEEVVVKSGPETSAKLFLFLAATSGLPIDPVGAVRVVRSERIKTLTRTSALTASTVFEFWYDEVSAMNEAGQRMAAEIAAVDGASLIAASERTLFRSADYT